MRKAGDVCFAQVFRDGDEVTAHNDKSEAQGLDSSP